MQGRLLSFVVIDRFRGWLSRSLAATVPRSISRRRIWLCAASTLIFCSTLTVRLLYWNDWQHGMGHRDNMHESLVHEYRREALRISRGGGVLFPSEVPEQGDARMLIHPPGYSMLLAGIYRLGGTQGNLLRIQIVADAIDAVMVFLIAAALFPNGLAIISGILVALSPHFSYYSLYYSPDTLSILPTLMAIYLLILA